MNEEDAGKRGRIAVVLAALLTAAVVIAGCSMIGVHTYEEFRSAVDSGATCSQLWDIEQNFEGTADEERVVSENGMRHSPVCAQRPTERLKEAP
jgi:hypothetical protein